MLRGKPSPTNGRATLAIGKIIEYPTLAALGSEFYGKAVQILKRAVTRLNERKKHLPADGVPLIPFGDFKQAVRKVLSASKREATKHR